MYDSEGGSSCNAKSGTIGEAWGTLCTTTFSGHTFGGWYTEPHGRGTKVTSSTIANGSIIVYANWGDTYKLTYDNRGGSGCTSKTGTLGEAWGTLCTPTYAGKTFLEWNTDADGDGETIDANTVVTGDLKVYAQYDDPHLYVYYNVSGGTCTTNPSGVTIDSDGFITRNGKDYYEVYSYGATGIDLINYNNTSWVNIERNGYHAISGSEWMDDSGNTYSQTTKYNYSDLCSSTNTDCFVVLNVNWDMNSYSISYTLNDGTVSGNPTSYTIETANITLINPTRNYYTFTGWTGTGLSSATTSVTIPQGSTGNRAYTANWTAQTYPITYNLNDGTVSPANPTSYTVLTNTFTLNNPTKNGYIFNGWTGTGLSSATATVTIAKGSHGDREYTANWTAQTYPITFDACSGTGGTTSATKTHGVNLSLSGITPPTKSGYTFTGWSKTSCSGTAIYTTSSSYTDNASATLYAIYEQDAPTLIEPELECEQPYHCKGAPGYWLVNLNDAQLAQARAWMGANDCDPTTGGNHSYCLPNPNTQLVNEVQLTIKDDEGNDITSQVTCTSSNTAVATVTASGCKVTRVSAGVTEITATLGTLTTKLKVYVANAAFRETAWDTQPASNLTSWVTGQDPYVYGPEHADDTYNSNGHDLNKVTMEINFLILGDPVARGSCKNTSGTNLCTCTQVIASSYGSTLNGQRSSVIGRYINPPTHSGVNTYLFYFNFYSSKGRIKKGDGSSDCSANYATQLHPLGKKFSYTNGGVPS